MNNPTEEQIKEFWEKCGFYQSSLSGHIDWCTPSGKICDHIGLKFPPPIDPNNLFKYAVPKPKSKSFLMLWILNLIQDWAMSKDTDPALALFWALHELMKKE